VLDVVDPDGIVVLRGLHAAADGVPLRDLEHIHVVLEEYLLEIAAGRVLIVRK
jgi:hypothetical protein